MGFLSNVSDKIRRYWAKDKEQVAYQMAKGSTFLGSPTFGYDLLQSYGYNVIADYLRIETDLLSRFVDYEEMDDYPEIFSALNIFADDSTQPDTQLNRTLWVTSPDKTTQTVLDDLFNRTLRIDEEAWEIARTLCKYGNDYEELLVTSEGVRGFNFLPPPTMRRIEGPRGELFGFVQDFQGRFGYSPEEFKQILANRTAAIQKSGGTPASLPDDGVAALEDWEVVHFRLRGKARRSIYGYSPLEGGRWIWKRLILLEDTALIYRLQRAPERFAFYVDVGDLPPAEALAYINKIRNQYKRMKYVNPTTGKMDLKFNPISQDEDFFLPTRQGQEGTKVDVLAGPVWQHMEDIEYFLGKLFSAIAIPKAYLAQDENINRATLSSEDVRFARSVLRIQRELRNGFGKVCRVHLAALGLDPLQQDYEVHMTVPSSIFELSQIEARTARADLAGRMKEFVSLYWLFKNVFHMSDDEIGTIVKQREEDVKREAMWQAEAEAEAQKLVQAATAAMGAEMGAPPGGAPAPEAVQRVGNRVLVRPQINVSKPSFLLPRVGPRGITEQELFRGAGREAEKRAEEKLDRILRNDVRLGRSLGELQGLLTDLARSQK